MKRDYKSVVWVSNPNVKHCSPPQKCIWSHPAIHYLEQHIPD